MRGHNHNHDFPTHAHARTAAHTHTHTRAHTHTHTRARAHTHTHTHTREEAGEEDDVPTEEAVWVDVNPGTLAEVCTVQLMHTHVSKPLCLHHAFPFMATYCSNSKQTRTPPPSPSSSTYGGLCRWSVPGVPHHACTHPRTHTHTQYTHTTIVTPAACGCGWCARSVSH